MKLRLEFSPAPLVEQGRKNSEGEEEGARHSAFSREHG